MKSNDTMLFDMKDSRGIVKFFDRGYILKFLLTIMMFSIIIPGEVVAFMFLQKYISLYLLIATATAGSIVLLPLSYLHISYYIKKIRILIYNGKYPDTEISLFTGAIIGGLLLVIPGIITKAAGILLLFSLPKKIVGHVVTRTYSGVKKDIYEYLKLYSG